MGANRQGRRAFEGSKLMIIAENFPYKHEFFKLFEEISKIPRGSGNTAAITKYCLDFANENGIEVMSDSMGNVVLKRPAGKGFENAEPIILQGHLDMVCEKTPDSNHDFTCDPLKLKYDGRFISAENTTLGADDGVAVAYGLALANDKDLQLPPLEILLTVDEETGLFGAAGLDSSMLSGKKLINLDSEEEGTLLCGCAGGITAEISEAFDEVSVSGTVLTVTLSGLAGGHSGCEIHKNRLNAAKVMAELLGELNVKFNLKYLVSGTKFNVIPNHSVAKIVVENCVADEAAEKIIAYFKENIKSRCADDRPKLSIERSDFSGLALSYENTKQVITYLHHVIDGVLEASEVGVVTSLNTGVSDYSDGKFFSQSLIRSMDNKMLTVVSDMVKKFTDEFKLNVRFCDSYPAWEYNEVSPLRDKMVEVFEAFYGKSAVVTTIHAGLECGIISEKIPGMDAVSIGCDVFDVHSVKEHLDAESAVRTYDYLVEVLKALK